ncbi:MAG: prephenate dehydrogenase [Clostridiales bacterium]|nr:prephenate dehydrogenase [Clostridiales bacterium]MCD7827369.1 prephenate dehydrogenase [Clostridiales bacterium]
MNIGIVGMGLIGGSMAKALRAYTDNKIYAYDLNGDIIDDAVSRNIIDRKLTSSNVSHCDLIIIALYPQAAIDFVKAHAESISKDAIVMDCCGVKRIVCHGIEPIADEYGFTYIGAHPMAGLHMSGFAYSNENLFKNSSLVLCPRQCVKNEKVYILKGLFADIGFTNIQISTPEEHDRIIAYTSQLCHIVSNAYVKNEAASMHNGFSAGSYRDLTRVAKLNETMWTELFLENQDYLLRELDELIENLVQYREALSECDKERLCGLLRDGRIRKEAIDGDVYRN